ncbi:hypothetical protein BC835DRAFT_92972 [Cytidiella melzeri]|nr:hypothetical protein BC835DRAFT_92972 [Cytidiella melzeri]
MASATFEFSPGKIADAFEYVRDCFEWLAAGGGDLESLAHELHLDKIARGAERLISDIRSVQNRLVPVNRLPPELLRDVFEHLLDPQDPAHLFIPFRQHHWPVVQSVCRHWRHTAVRTPMLWSYVRVRDRHSYVTEDPSDLASKMFMRSGVAPLTVHVRSRNFVDTDRGLHDESLRNQLALNSWRIYELHTICAEPVVLDSCLQEASQLEILIVNDPGGHEDFVYSQWRLPRLRTLVAGRFTGWNGGVFRTLRHLILENQIFNAEILSGLHALLGLNPQLEDLMLHCLSEKEGLDTTLDALPSLSMPCLRRISTKRTDYSSVVGEELVSKKLVLEEGHAKLFIYPVPAHHLFTGFLQKLFITTDDRVGCVVGTDGQSGFCMYASRGDCHDQCAALSWQPRLQELWLCPNSHLMQDDNHLSFDWTAWFKAMKEVKKIVLFRDIHRWLDYIHQHHLFPSLTELQLQSPLSSDETAILDFLEARARTKPIQTLRFAPYKAGHCFVVRRWKDDASVLTRFASRVVFEDKPLRMELPVVCATDSAAHRYWPSWENYMYQKSLFP